MIRRSDDHAIGDITVKYLQKAVYHALELSVLSFVLPTLADGIELVEEQNPSATTRKVEDFAEVRRSFS